MLHRGMRAALLSVLVLVAACGGSSSSKIPCEKVIDHLQELSKSLTDNGMPTPSADDRARMIQACEDHDGDDERACEVAAKDIDAYFACGEKR
jgi:hypothetical protein